MTILESSLYSLLIVFVQLFESIEICSIGEVLLLWKGVGGEASESSKYTQIREQQRYHVLELFSSDTSPVTVLERSVSR